MSEMGCRTSRLAGIHGTSATGKICSIQKYLSNPCQSLKRSGFHFRTRYRHLGSLPPRHFSSGIYLPTTRLCVLSTRFSPLFEQPTTKEIMDDRATTNALLAPGEELSAQEQEVIDEYVRLADNMKKVSCFIRWPGNFVQIKCLTAR